MEFGILERTLAERDETIAQLRGEARAAARAAKRTARCAHGERLTHRIAERTSSTGLGAVLVRWAFKHIRCCCRVHHAQSCSMNR